MTARDAYLARPVSATVGIVLFALFLTGCLGCAKKPLVEATTPVPVGCGPMPELPTLCLETLPADAAASETMRCYAETVAQLVADDRAVRAQFAPCARP